jgi:hypothetical protein
MLRTSEAAKEKISSGLYDMIIWTRSTMLSSTVDLPR